METVFIDRRSAVLSVNQGRLYIKGPEHATSLPLRQMQALVISCDCQLSVAMLRTLSEFQVSLICLNPRNIDASMISVPQQHGNVQRRIAQYALLQHQAHCVHLARLLLRRKIIRARQTLTICLASRPDCRTALFKGQQQLTSVIEQLPAQRQLSSLLGCEGAAARAYFSAMQTVFPASWGFTKRIRRPPTDPINAMLSLGYTLLYFDALRACHSAGLDPQLGLLHQPCYGRASLACDLVELLRHQVDRLVWDLVRHQLIRREHFTHEQQGACLLNKTGRQHFYEAYMLQAPQWLATLRRYSALFARHLDTQVAPWPATM